MKGVEMLAVLAGVLLLVAALVRGAASKVGWLIFRGKLGRLLTTLAVLAVVLLALTLLGDQ